MKPHWIAPELATLADKPFSNDEWIFEEKFDGIRCIAINSGGKVTLFSRNHKLLNDDFPEIVQALEQKKSKDYVVDGEVVAFTGRATSFSKLQNRAQKKIALHFYLFDLLLWDKRDIRKYPLLERKKWLKAHFPFGGPIHYTPHVEAAGEAFYKKMCKRGLEGAIAKRAASVYLSKRTRDWLKFKCSKGQELVIGGYTEPQGSRVNFGALLLGYYERGKFHYAGKVGTGFDTAMLDNLGEKLKRLEKKSSPFAEKIKEKGLHFVRPTLVCEVGFTEWTNEGKLRHPRFLGLRKDKPAKSVVRERA
ncbi:MAG: non-homologous end-joining DNA ligase [Verrucomicrobia bacterium]|nr:non-homologous end-joining DNA ligase [Verrucomicrobiota bacterium]